MPFTPHNVIILGGDPSRGNFSVAVATFKINVWYFIISISVWHATCAYTHFIVKLVFTFKIRMCE